MSTATGARITAQGWSFEYPGRSAPALCDVAFTVEPGALVVLMGASGSGKSTLLAALAGTLPEGGASGELRVRGPDGRPVRIGVVRQEPEGNIVMERVGDDVAFPLENAAVPADRIWPRVSDALDSVGLRVPLDRATSRLSGGQQQLLAVAAAAVADPDLLLLDEPTANLDPAAAADVLAAVERVRAARGCTVIIVEHRVEAWLERADAILLADAGVVVGLSRAELGAHLAQRPDAASRLWIDHAHLPHHAPADPPGNAVLAATGVAVDGRLPATDLDLRAREVVAVTGPPGSGKSTLLACLAGLLTPTAGAVRVRSSGLGRGARPGDGPADAERVDPWSWSSVEVARSFGVVFQNPEHQFVTGRAFEEVHHGLAGAGVDEPEASDRSAQMLERLHLSHLSSADPFTLSGGEQRRLSVGTALALDPGILILDEPTFGQDPVTWAELVGIIADHRDAGGSVVMASHDPDLVRALAAREIRLDPVPPADGAEGPAVPPPATGLRRLDPLALLGSAMVLSAAALVSGSVALNLTLALLAIITALVGGLAPRRVALLSAPAILAAASVAFSNALLSGDGLTAASSWAAAALPASRVLAVALPGLVAAIALDPTQLADALVVRAHVPARPAYSVLAGLRLLPLLSDEWEVLGRASRARGLGGSGVRARISQFGSMTFRLLVAALRRGGQLAMALDARGLRPGAARTVARPLRWSWWDPIAVLVAVAGLVAALWTRLG